MGPFRTHCIDCDSAYAIFIGRDRHARTDPYDTDRLACRYRQQQDESQLGNVIRIINPNARLRRVRGQRARHRRALDRSGTVRTARAVVRHRESGWRQQQYCRRGGGAGSPGRLHAIPDYVGKCRQRNDVHAGASTRCEYGAKAEFCMSSSCGPLASTDGRSVGFSTRRDDPSN
jgi:hypothetical protein